MQCKGPDMKTLLAAAVAAVIASPVALAGPMQFATMLSPEVLGATGSGQAFVTIDTAIDRIRISFSYSGLSGVTTVAHIHCCVASPGTVGVAIVPPSLPGFVTLVSMGSYNREIDLSLAANFGGGFRSAATAAGQPFDEFLLSGLLAGRAYLNIHSNIFPAGEIRGFFAPVPAPMSLGLLAAALVGLAAARRRRV